MSVSIAHAARKDPAGHAAVVQDRASNEIHLRAAGGSEPLPFQPSDPVRLKYSQEGILFCWDARITSREDQGRRLVAQLSGEGITLQRRQSPRLAASIPFSFTVIEAEERSLIGEQAETRTQDISLGGMKFETNLPLKVGDKLALELSLPEQTSAKASGWVARTEAAEGGEGGQALGVKFLQLEARDQLHLLRYLAKLHHR